MTNSTHKAVQAPQPAPLTVPGGPSWLLPGDVVSRIANEHRVSAGAVQDIAKAVYQLQAPAVGAVTAEFLRSLKSAADWSGHPAVNKAHELLSAAPQASAAPVPAEWRKAVQEAYGWLWHINNEPLAPVPLLSEGKASYQARKALRDLLTSTERGEAINAVTATIDKIKAAAPAPTTGSEP